jgi:hypothetical protein
MGSILGKGSKSKMPSNANISAGGITTSGSKTITATSSPERTGLIGRIAATFPEQANFLAGLRSKVAPGVSALRASRLAGLEGSRSRAVGDLRENLAQRRVLGSSFAQDSLTRANLEFQQEKDKVEAESFLQELELSHMIATEEFEARRGEFQTTIDDLNLQADIATQLATAATSQLGANARLKAELDAQNASGLGSFIGKIAGMGLGLATGGIVPAGVGVF